ncbi:PE-PPE domain-containing protein [Streptomyces sp. NPDC048506]|uniref:PE-PPE domain-containing protein n=1 Tax=Streptomyces sp. NPDC048506 TaxID=3155028 RepID=UPI003446A9B3
MSKTSRWMRAMGTAAMTVATAVATVVVAPTVAQADPIDHYYIEIGGTSNQADAPECTTSYREANKLLEPGSWVPVCYPASAGPWENGHGIPDLTTPSYDASVNEGYRNLLAAAEDTHRQHPDARLTIVGYSQGAQAADELLQRIANNETSIPREQVNGMLYADPMQPGTGIWARVPKGVGALGFTSAGAGPEEFPGVPVARYCIRTDGICDATSIESPGGYLIQHPKYPQPGDVMTQTITHDGANGIFWTDAH